MSEKNKDILIQKRKELQLKLAAKDYYSYFIKDWLPIYVSLRKLPLHLEVVYVCMIEPEYKIFVEQLLENENSSSMFSGTDLVKCKLEETILKKLYEFYPSQNLLSYVPLLKPIGNFYKERSTIADFFETQKITETFAYVIYTRYSPVMRVLLADFIHYYPIFKQDDYYDEILVFPANYSWLLLCSSDDTWLFDTTNENYLNFSYSPGS